ncbi:MAG: sugar phosphate isomerase/epimerase and 4-hydroxyphenylpyruvate domain-containing protein [Alphaproteobacteria bacterium]|nr:sugar phosphate isomerase/epimerase and 4-hydroxyphenylpyruvate domain-containing protein [Alphaproteobacteria bacterium]
MRTAIATVSLSGTLEEKFEAIAAACFTGVEIFENDLLSYSGSPADAKRIAGDLGLEIVTFQPFRDFEGLPEPARSRAFARAERKFDLMQELGTDLLLICSNVAPDALGGIDRAAEDFRLLGEKAAARGLRVGFEALAWGRHINDYRDAWEVVRRADHPSVGLVLDTFHALARKTDLKAIRAIPRDRIFLVQVADAPLLDMDYLNWSRHFRCLPGQGDLPLDDFMDALGATRFDGILSLEIFSDRFRAGSTRAVAVDGRRSLLFMLDELRKRGGGELPGVAPLPERSRCHGVEFIEFAVDDAFQPGFETLLRGLGFRRSGQHRSKAVTRWSQGGINLVLNAEKEGFAHSYNVAHGSSVCALALRVDDAEAAMARARALLDQSYRGRIGPGELAIPALRGLGSSLLYLVDQKTASLWETDFRAVEDDGDTLPAGLTDIDHVQQSMPYEEMLTWLLFYVALLDVAKSPVQEVVDPGGVVHSQVVQTADGALRLVLNASQSRRTLSARFLDGIVGSGVQHLAFATDDIVATVERLKAAGVDLLPIPENYYDDLEAKGLAPEEIDRLRRLDILYDRDGSAEYRQAYTRSLAEGFFFEIVERRGYVGFGAVNAPIRLAAQTRFARPASPL